MKYKTPKKKTVETYRKRIKSLQREVERKRTIILELRRQLNAKGVSQLRHELDQAQIMALREQVIKYHEGDRSIRQSRN